MIISVNWLKKFTNIDGSIDQVAALIGARLVEIEEVVDLGKKYEGVVVAKVVECAPVEDSDHLNATKLDDGGVVRGVERDENGFVQVVCGAPNVRTGLLVAWLPPNTTVPETIGTNEPFVLDARKLRGVMSNGMIASARELALFDDHEGILEIDKDIAPGTSFATAYELDDYLFDIENKSLTHRPDTFGLIGFAREVAAIQGKAFTTPERLRSAEPEWEEKEGDIPTPKVAIDDPELSARYQAVVLTNVDAKAKSPLETQTYLSRIGVRPHSAVVDATNYLMMLTGQPLHAFDYDKLKAVNNGEIDIHVRAAGDGEKLKLLDGREIELASGDIVIANGEKAVALAGAMGGAETEIDENTTNVLLESATFNLFNLRNTQFRHGIFSEAITRFTKGQPGALTAPVLSEAVSLLKLSAGAKRASDVADAYPGKRDNFVVEVNPSNVNALLGSNYTADVMGQTLRNVGFTVEQTGENSLAIIPPYWRADIHIFEDVAEEVGRINGYDAITPVLPKRDFTAVSRAPFDELRANIRKNLMRAGANEVLTYSFVHGDLLKKVGQDPQNGFRIVNSLSPDLQYYRQSLMPSLLNLIHSNSKAGYDDFAIFELNKVHAREYGVDDSELPIEQDQLAFVITHKKELKGDAYYEAKSYVEFLAHQLGITFQFVPITDSLASANSAPFEYRRSAYIQTTDGETIGVIGEFRSPVLKNFKLSKSTAGFVIETSKLAQAVGGARPSYQPLSRYPSTDRDICFQVDSAVTYGQLIASVDEVLSSSELITSITPVDIYQAEQSQTKNITIRITLASYDKTLTGDEISSVIEEVTTNIAADIGARVI